MSTAVSEVGALGTISSKGSEFDCGVAMFSIEKSLIPSALIA